MRAGRTLVGIAVASGVWASSARAMVPVDISPSKPRATKAIKVSFPVKKRLPAGQLYSATVGVKSGPKCAASAVKETASNPAAGGTVTIRFVPADDESRKASRWCTGTAGASVQIVRDDGTTVRIIGIEGFRIYG